MHLKRHPTPQLWQDIVPVCPGRKSAHWSTVGSLRYFIRCCCCSWLVFNVRMFLTLQTTFWRNLLQQMLQKHGYRDSMLSNIDFTHGILEAAQCFSPVVFTSSDARGPYSLRKRCTPFGTLLKRGIPQSGDTRGVSIPIQHCLIQQSLKQGSCTLPNANLLRQTFAATSKLAKCFPATI